MHLVYLNSILTLAALDSANANEGFLTQSLPDAALSCAVPVFVGSRSTPSKDVHFPHTRISEYQSQFHFLPIQYPDRDTHKVEAAPLNQRGWVLQERLLSPRILSFGTSRIDWECKESRSSVFKSIRHLNTRAKGPNLGLDTKSIFLRQVCPFPNLPRNIRYYLRKPGQVVEPLCRSFDKLVWRECAMFEWMAKWKAVLIAYSACALTKQEDRLAAIAGITRSFEEAMPGPNYLGIWVHDLNHELLWRSNGPGKRSPLKVPSWTWASLEGRVRPFREVGPWVRAPGVDLSTKFRSSTHHLCQISLRALSSDHHQSSELELSIRGHLMRSFVIEGEDVIPYVATEVIKEEYNDSWWVGMCLKLRSQGRISLKETGAGCNTLADFAPLVVIDLDQTSSSAVTEVDLLPLQAFLVRPSSSVAALRSVTYCVEGLVVMPDKTRWLDTNNGRSQAFSRIGRFTAIFKVKYSDDKDYKSTDPYGMNVIKRAEYERCCRAAIWAWLCKHPETEIVLE